jgi:hypothetical protein
VSKRANEEHFTRRSAEFFVAGLQTARTPAVWGVLRTNEDAMGKESAIRLRRLARLFAAETAAAGVFDLIVL